MKHWKIWLSIVISAIFLYFAFDNIDWKKLWGVIKMVNYTQATISMVIVAAMLIVRGHRWSLFLKPLEKIRVIPLFWSTAIGFGVNNILPARLGEVARAYSLSKKSHLKFGEAFGSVVVERLYDTFSVLFLFVICLFVFDFPDLSKLVGRSQNEIAVLFGISACVLLSGVLLLKVKTDFMLKIGGFFLRPLPDRISKKILDTLRAFINGLTQTKNPFEVVWILVLSFGLWIISAYTVWLVVDACHVRLDIAQTMVVLMSLVVAVSIPAAPGYAGTYHYLASTALMLVTGIGKEEAISIATMIHATNYIPQTVLGLGGLAYEGIKISEVKKVREDLDRKN